jgi:hypothetical protein
LAAGLPLTFTTLGFFGSLGVLMLIVSVRHIEGWARARPGAGCRVYPQILYLRMTEDGQKGPNTPADSIAG